MSHVHSYSFVGYQFYLPKQGDILTTVIADFNHVIFPSSLHYRWHNVLEDGSYSLTYMKKAKKDDQLYTWPEGDDIFYVHPRSDIVAKLDSAVPVSVGARLLSRFNMTKANEAFNQK